jgi:RNA polymerase sigma factor (sigma-70 family)
MCTHPDPEPIDSPPEWDARYLESYERDAPGIRQSLRLTFPAHDYGDIEDAIQEAYKRLWALPDRTDVSNIGAFARVAAHRLLSTQRRTTRRRQGYEREVEARLKILSTQGRFGDQFDRLNERERLDAVCKALASLDPRQRAVMHYRAQGLTHEEIGKLLGVSKQRASEIVGKTIKTLKERINGRA